MPVNIRRATEADESALSKICLLTADAGHSAEPLHDHGELPGLIYAVPYVKLPTTWGFVMEDEEKEEVVGYVLGSTDTRYFEQIFEKEWLPPLRAKYLEEEMKKPGDIGYCKLLKKIHTASEESIKFSSVHLHIDILKEYQRKGWGKKLIEKATEYLKEEGFETVWVGMDPRNTDAKLFYRKLGFQEIDGAGENMLGLRFWAFK
ncbi:acyl-CoA N-acyltransferase [Crepidotus variabilis]|uniref:Acyl-CoA N-acyltransferase n=1 Tax=Crepidotus variabilis TaxID=179855 RepID=A0A9P6EDJ7_9AGAR|nr:acyl-CoA N-acyltransferase [Crepidotus variabilis]